MRSGDLEMGDHQLLCFKMLLLQSALTALALTVFVSAAVQDPEILVEEETGSVTIQKDLMVNASGLAGKPEAHLGLGGNGGVYILNQLPGWNQGFTVHCYASGNDQGWHTISPHVVYEFHFQIHDVWDAMFTCTFICPSLGNTATFQAFGPDVAQVNQCVDCLWMVRTDGFYLQSRSQAPGQGTFMYHWGYQE